MTFLEWTRWLCVILYGFTLFLEVYGRHREDNRLSAEEKRKRNYISVTGYYGLVVPLYITFILANVLFLDLLTVVGYFAEYILYICIYDLVLLMLMPLFRRCVSARTCSILWEVPIFLFVLAKGGYGYRALKLVIPVSKSILRNLAWIWFAGCAAVIIWKITEHLLFRRRVLTDAVRITDSAVLEIWKQEKRDAVPEGTDFELVISPEVSSPLSVGVLWDNTVVVLPERSYTLEELRMIFRHELIHICRNDGKKKLFLVFCAAMCWFNPLVWISMKRSAEDLELSCDEIALLEANDETRRQYAHLILTTAGEHRGFTTCLSAAKSSMRYRLKHIVRKRNLRSGAVLTLVLFLICTMCYGRIAVGYDVTTVREVMEQTEVNTDLSQARMLWEDERTACTDPENLWEYLNDLSVCRLLSRRDPDEDNLLEVRFHDMNVILREHTLILDLDSGGKTTYYINEPVDWAYLESLFI